MLVKHLLDDLKTMDPEAVVGFSGNGTWLINGLRYGKIEESDRGYVLLTCDGNNTDREAHTPPVEDKRH